MIRIKNWSKYQHYRDRNPPWIKLHVSLLNDRDFCKLSCASKGLLMQLWVLASEQQGEVSDDLEELRFRLRDSTIKQKDIDGLVQRGFLTECNQVLADASTCSPETETETETETEQRPTASRKNRDTLNSKQQGLFDRFWAEYPKKRSKGQAERAFAKLNPDEQLIETMLSTIKRAKPSNDWQKDNGQYIPNPATWLNARGWEDEYNPGTPNRPSQELKRW